MHKNAQTVEQRIRPKFPATTPGCSMLKIARLDDAFLELSFLTAGKSSRRSITAAKRKEKEKQEKQKTIPKTLKILISAHARVKMS